MGLSNQHPSSLMLGRLGIYSNAPGQPSTVDGIKSMDKTLLYKGGYHQQSRMIRDKRKSFDKAVLYSYQGAEVQRPLGDLENVYRALINPNKVKQDYDDKILSIGYESSYEVGDVFQWMGTKTYWLVYLQDLTELAYFKGNIRRCQYQISWKDDNDNIHTTYAAVRGPVETKINFIQKNGISVDTPNHSLELLLPGTEESIKQFTRYSKFYLQGDSSICWRVEARDWISMPHILQITAVEYYKNEDEDDLDNGLVGGLIVDPISPNTPEIEETIEGETFIRPKKKYRYNFTGSLISDWTLDTQLPIEASEISEHCIELTWIKPVSGQFKISYGTFEKIVIVESLF